MKKILILAAAAAIFALSLSSCNTGSSSMKTTEDSLAYCMGTDIATYIRQQDSTINVDILVAAFRDVFKGKAQISTEDSYNFQREYYTVRKPAIDLKKSVEFLEKVEKDTKGIQKTESGILYVVERPGSEVKAKTDSDIVRVMYRGTLPNGTEFDSSYSRGDTVEFPLNAVIKGWTEGMKLIGEGGKIKMWLPSDMAYGERGGGQGSNIGPNQALVFEVELVSVAPAAEKAKK